MPAAVGFDGKLAECQSQAGAHAVVLVFDLAELFKDTLVMFWRNARAGVGDCHADLGGDSVRPMRILLPAGV